MADGGTFVEALYAYSYQAADGRQIAFTEGETFTLINKSNEDWWHVKRDGEKPMYVPATYMKVLMQLDDQEEYEDSSPIPGHTRGDTKSVSSLGSEDCFLENDGACSEQYSPSQTFDENCINEKRRSIDSNGKRNSLELHPVDGASVKSLTKTLESSSIKLRGSISSRTDLLMDRPKSQSLPHGWALATDTETGRPYYFNAKTNETSWKPPRTKSVPSPRSSPVTSPRTSRSSLAFEKVTPPVGWRMSRSISTEELIYVNDYNNEKWQSSTDEYGRTYFYQINGTLTAWELPEVVPVTRQSFEALDVTFRQKSPNLRLRGSKSQTLLMRGSKSFYNQTNWQVDLSPLELPPFPSMHERTESNLSADSLSSDESPLPAPPVAAPSCTIGSVERQGSLNRKKIVESGGKKIKRPSWTQTFVMLFSTNLVFFKDQKSALAKPGLPHGKPESSCDLRGANLVWVSNMSITKKKNSFQVSTVSGAIFLLQTDVNALAMEWFNGIASVIYRLNEDEPSFAGTVQGTPGSQDTFAAATVAKGYESDDALEDNTPVPSTPTGLTAGTLLRSLSKRRSGADDRINMRDKLKKLISRRPPIEELEKKGIIQERRVFDCHLNRLCDREGTTVPTFVAKVIEAIEKRGLDFDGLYRVSGNLSMIQKLRIMVDQEEKVKIGEAPFDDVHVLTGSLKLFFRELPEPLFPFDFYNGFVEAIKQSTRVAKLNSMKKLTSQLPLSHRDTLRHLLRHLTKVIALSDTNRMHAQNLAIVFGPTLMWPRIDTGNIALNTVHQNQIVEFLLLEYENVFK